MSRLLNTPEFARVAVFCVDLTRKPEWEATTYAMMDFISRNPSRCAPIIAAIHYYVPVEHESQETLHSKMVIRKEMEHCRNDRTRTKIIPMKDWILIIDGPSNIVVACAAYRPTTEYEGRISGLVVIGYFEVDSKYRRKKYGTLLMHLLRGEIFRKCRAFYPIIVRVKLDAGEMRFWFKLGFEPSGPIEALLERAKEDPDFQKKRLAAEMTIVASILFVKDGGATFKVMQEQERPPGDGIVIVYQWGRSSLHGKINRCIALKRGPAGTKLPKDMKRVIFDHCIETFGEDEEATE
jgi:GNAT superfamily N-acetyltransferase